MKISPFLSRVAPSLPMALYITFCAVVTFSLGYRTANLVLAHLHAWLAYPSTSPLYFVFLMLIAAIPVFLVNRLCWFIAVQLELRTRPETSQP